MTVSKYKASGQKVKSVPIIHCAPFAYTDLVAERKWRLLQVAREFLKLGMLQWFLNLACEIILVSKE